MSELRLLIGLPGCGKTQYALALIEKEPGRWFRINWDEMRRDRGMMGKRFNRVQEEEMQKASFNFAEEKGANYNIVVDNTNLNENTRNRWKGVAQRAHMTYTEVDLNQPLGVCIERDAKREGDAQVGRAVIERMALWAHLIEFPRKMVGAGKDIVIVDVDGTIGDCSHRLPFIDKICKECKGAGYTDIVPRPEAYLLYKCEQCGGSGERKKDWDGFFAAAPQDRPIDSIISLVRLIYEAGYIILIVSGRPIDKGGKITVDWLARHNVPYHHIFMRNGEDKRDDDIVKMEILDKLPQDRIKWVFDDRQRVVDAWRSRGLKCLQCADGDF